MVTILFVDYQYDEILEAVEIPTHLSRRVLKTLMQEAKDWMFLNNTAELYIEVFPGVKISDIDLHADMYKSRHTIYFSIDEADITEISDKLYYDFDGKAERWSFVNYASKVFNRYPLGSEKRFTIGESIGNTSRNTGLSVRLIDRYDPVECRDLLARGVVPVVRFGYGYDDGDLVYEFIWDERNGRRNW